MTKLVLLRHGESTWNLENRFTGWTDVDLTPKGVAEAHEAARLLKEAGHAFDVAFVSLLKRAIRTLWIVQDDMDRMWLPVHRNWRLNERHYGALQGLNKAETAAKYGEAQVLTWRRSYSDPPPPAHPGRRAPSLARPALRGPGPGRAAPGRVAQGHRRPLPALLARVHRPRRARGQAGSSSPPTGTACAPW